MTWIAFFLGMAMGVFVAYGALGVYGLVLLKRSDDDES